MGGGGWKSVWKISEKLRLKCKKVTTDYGTADDETADDETIYDETADDETADDEKADDGANYVEILKHCIVQDRARRKGQDVRPDSKFTGRKRKDKF